MEDIGDFPRQEIPINRYTETDLNGELSYGNLSNMIGKLNLSLYQPSGYITDAGRIKSLEAEKKRHNFNQRDREHYLIAMMRTNLLKRLESSAHSLELTLGRSIGKIDAMLAKIELYKSRMSAVGTSRDYDAISIDDVLPDNDEDDEELIVGRGENPYRLSELNLEAWVKDMGQDRARLQVMHEQVSQITPERDGKLRQIKDDLREKAHSPGVNLNGDANRKTLVFTTFKDTAIYLYENLRPLAGELDLRIAMVSGDETHTVAGRNGYNEILDNFAPVARNRGESGRGHRHPDCHRLHIRRAKPSRLRQGVELRHPLESGAPDTAVRAYRPHRQSQQVGSDGQLLADQRYGRVPEAGEPRAGTHGYCGHRGQR